MNVLLMMLDDLRLRIVFDSQMFERFSPINFLIVIMANGNFLDVQQIKIV